MAPCKNVRHLSSVIVNKDGSSCLAPGLFMAVGALQKIVQVTLTFHTSCMC